MAFRNKAGRAAFIILGLAMLVMCAPGSALAVKYYTETGTVTATAVGTTISVSATYSTNAANCGNGGDTAPTFNVEWDLTPADWTGAGYGSSGALADSGAVSPFEYTTPILSPGTYAVRVTYADANGVNACTTPTSVTVNAGSNVTIVANGLTVGINSAAVNSSSQITATATFTDDLNADSTTKFEYGTSATGPWTVKCASVTGASPRACVIDGLNADTDYWIRVTHTDADGVTGTNPEVVGPYHTQTAIPCDKLVNDCADCHTMPPATDDHQISSHKGGGNRAACAVCHVKYSPLVNVTSSARWTTRHTDRYLDIYTSNKVPNRIFAAPYDKGIKGGYYKGYRNKTSIWGGKTANTNNVCTVTYCHGAGNSPIWDTGTTNCTSCHAQPPAAGKHSSHSQGYAGYANKSVAGAYDFGCYKCHDKGSVTHASGPVTANQAAGVAFDNRTSPKNASGSYAAGALAGTDGTLNWTNGTCNTTYCHSNGAGANVTNPTWNGTLAANCLGCHRGDKASGTAMNTGQHTAHVNNADATLATIACKQCHNYTLSANRTLSDKSRHVNEVKDIFFQALGAYTGFYVSGTQTCRNVYCHSSGQAASSGEAGGDTPVMRTITWASAAIVCNGCHGADNYYTDVNGSPDYQNLSTVSRAKFNGHYVSGHVGAAGDCSKCHRGTVNVLGNISSNSIKHLNAARDINFRSDIGGTYNTAIKRCTNVSCHAGTTLRWGGTATCADCHQVTAAETDDFTYNNATKATVNFYEYTSVGHGKKGTYRYGTSAGANLSCTSSSDTATNGGCHRNATPHGAGTNPFRLVSSTTIKPTSPNTLCTASCHNSAAIQNHEKAITGGTKYATWFFTPKCVDCHDPHGDNGGKSTSRRNHKMVQSFVNYSGASTAYGVPSYRRAVDFPANIALPVSMNRSSYVRSSKDGICQICHRRGFGAAFNRSTNSEPTHNTGMVCATCHGHSAGFKGTGDCKGCHNQVQNGRPNIQAEFEKKSHHIIANWASITASACSVCHMEGDASGNPTSYHNNNVGGGYPVDLRIVKAIGASESATIGDANNQTYVSFYTGNGTNGGTPSTGNVANRHCGSCHSITSTTVYPWTTSEGTSKKAPAAYDGSFGTVFARYTAALTTASHRYSNNTSNVVPRIRKAYSPHGRPEKNQMKNLVTAGTTWTDDSQTVSNAIGCLDCHNSHGSSAGANEGTTRMLYNYSSLVGGRFGGLIKQTAAYDPDKKANGIYNAASDLCFDCHLGDDATAPKNYSNFGVARAVKEYYDAGRWQNNTSVWTGSFSYKSTDNSGKIRGSHFRASSNLTNSASGISGSCMACHDPHGTPYGGYVGTGTDRSFMAPALKGTWMSSPYKEDRVADDAGTATTSNTYDFYNQIGKKAARENPNFSYNNPPNLGAGFGAGWATANFGKGGTGQDGYFVDDNTFGTQYTYGNNGTAVDVTSTQYKSDAQAKYIRENDTQFAGLCLGCHTAANLQAISNSNGTDTAIKVHNTVKGWSTSGNTSDLFKNRHAGQHSAGYYIGTGFAGQADRCSTAYLYFPAGYRWSVRMPLIRIDQASAGAYADISGSVADPPAAVANTQSTVGYKQTGFHQFPCAKCHAPHSTKLPRLMKTNCLDVGTGITSGGNPRHTTAYNLYNCDTATDTKFVKPMVCHGAGPTNGGARNITGGGGWNTKTGW